MIQISDKSKCCGCTACVNICPRQCIVMRRDREGFDYPVANPDMCIHCGRCESVCPVLNPASDSKPIAAYAMRSSEYMEGSSSGGVFPALAKSVLERGGVVFGAVMESDMTVGHVEADTMDQVQRMRGSKYVQSDLYSVFEDIKEYLKSGRKVLFTGTPCQVAGLKGYLGDVAEGLLAVDLACHGVPGPGLWEKYVGALAKRADADVSDVSFRDKSASWRHYSVRYTYASETTGIVTIDAARDPYMALFRQDMTLRPSCYRCPARNGRSHSDLTLADLWSVHRTAPGFNDDRGVSGVLVNTETGDMAMRGIEGMEMTELSPADVLAENGGFSETVAVPEKRQEFFDGLQVAGTDIYRHMSEYVVRRPLKTMYKRIRSALSSFKRRISK